MNLMQQFVESEAKKMFKNYRERFDVWLDTTDIDKNGVKDKEQILENLDRVRDGVLEVLSAATDLHKLATKYYQTYGKDITGEGTPGNDSSKGITDKGETK
jgi:hypothetical protein